MDKMIQNDEAEFPQAKAKEILSNTAQRIGYDEHRANLLAQAAWWLENRHLSGISQLVVYLCLIQDLTFDSLLPKRDGETGMRCVCPVSAALLLAGKFNEGQFGLQAPMGFRGPASPLLMSQILAVTARDHDVVCRMRYYDQSLILSMEDVTIENESMATLTMIDERIKHHTTVEFIKKNPTAAEQLTLKVRKKGVLKLPKKRLVNDEYLDLD